MKTRVSASSFLGRVVAAVCAAALLLHAAPGAATEVETEEDILLMKLTTGAESEARAGFAALFERRFAQADAVRTTGSVGVAAIEDEALHLRGAARAVDIWQAGEVALRSGARTTPPEVVRSVIAAADRLHAKASLLRQAGGARAAPRRNADGSATALQFALDQVATCLEHAVSFTRGEVPEADRSALLAKARSLVAAPATVAAFDALHPDLRASLAVAPPPQGAPRRTPKRERVTRLEGTDTTVRPLLVQFYSALLARDRAALGAAMADGYTPPDTLIVEIETAWAGRRLDGIGGVSVRSLRPDEVEVTVEELRLVAADGSPVILRDTLVLAGSEGEEYRVAFVGSAAEREEAR